MPIVSSGISGKDQTPLLGSGSQQNPIMAFTDINVPLAITGPTTEVHLGFFAPRDGENIKWGATVSLAQAPAAAASFVTVAAGSKRDTVLISVWKSTFAAADAATVTKVSLIATRGSAVAQ